MAGVALQVVDVGGGTGFCTQGIVQTVRPSNVTLIDQSPHQLAKARKKADLQGTTVVQVSSTQVKGLLALVNPDLSLVDHELLRAQLADAQ